MRQTDIVADFRTLETKFPNIANDDSKPGRGWAVKVYLNNGGIVKLSDKGSLTYPSKAKLDRQITDWKKKRGVMSAELQGWINRYNRAKNELLFLKIRKVTVPEYWKHVVMYQADKEYRSDFDRVGMRTEFSTVSTKRFL